MVRTLLLTLMVALSLAAPRAAAQSAARGKTFTLVIDAGHGGHDIGAPGRTINEKTINLNVALEFGRLVKQNCPEVKVVYTRSRDVFVSLQGRADIANRNKADLFVSIHTNALAGGRIAHGAETYTLGMARAESNLDVAKRENAVIMFEENYEQTYEGFDPNRTESYIIFELMQDRYMKESVELARDIQRAYVAHAGRKDKGVHQAGFLVLRQVSMPAVLTELGFISTPAEERFLASKEGVQKMGRSIYNGFKAYYDRHVARTSGATPPQAAAAAPAQESRPAAQQQAEAASSPAQQGEAEPQQGQPVFKVQVLASAKRLAATDRQLRGLSPVDSYRDGNLYKYTYGATTSYQQARRLRQDVLDRFPEAFIVAFVDGERIPLDEARRRANQK